MVTGYALMFDNANTKSADFGTATAINAATLGLNQTIQDVVHSQRASGVPTFSTSGQQSLRRVTATPV